MKFASLEVQNLRAIERFAVEDLTDFVMVAGQNGSGKSCVFDAIRLLKSFYGGHLPDEHMQWFAEFSVNLHERGSLRKLLRDPAKPLLVKASFEFADSEEQYLRDNVKDLAWPMAWEQVTGQRLDPWTFNRMAIATQLPRYQAPVDQLLAEIEAAVTSALTTKRQDLSLEISPDGALTRSPCAPAQVAFQAYRPDHLGIIEYHSASRAYVRQEVGGINLDARQFADQRRQQTLYNWQGKYQNVKTELAASYVRSLISQAAEEEIVGEDLNETLKKLFQQFFPDKTYEGVRPIPGGTLEFPVRLQTGHMHDIDDLSSGEKEILYGYLRLRNATPRNSVILLDEPELHLNPSLLQGFPDFYNEHLGQAQGNQLWLVTHSDALLRQTIGNSNYRVFHMLPASALGTADNQAAEILLDDDLERATVDLVGDLASYRPHAKVVILEGDATSSMDEAMVRRLFPDFARRVNLVSGGPKRRVRDLYRVLAEAIELSGIQNRFFAIVDPDSEGLGVDAPAAAQEFAWDVYHIENYLLDPPSVRAAAVSLTRSDQFSSDAEVLQALKDCAELIVDRLVLQQVQQRTNDRFLAELDIGAPPDSTAVAADLLPSIEGSARRVTELAASLTPDALQQQVEEARSVLVAALEDGTWIARFPGRLILHRFAATFAGGVKYETLANVILGAMVEKKVAPVGMKNVLDQILQA